MDRTYLLQALAEAEKGLGFTHPNPAVGAIVVKDRVIASGFHEKAGEPHAEVRALQHLTHEQCNGATLYITLEPCCHFGKTPPCTDLILEKGISRVVYGLEDPNPFVAGKGAACLRANGVAVEHLADPNVNQFYQPYVHWTQHKRPWVAGKLALSLDGKIAGASGKPIKLTSEKVNAFTQAQRAQSNAILTSINTVLNDNPRMNARLAHAPIKKPLYVIDPYLKLHPSLNIFSSTGPITVFASEAAPHENANSLGRAGATIVRCPCDEKGRFHLPDILGRVDATRLWVEVGGKLFSQFLFENLFHETFLYLTPHWLGADATPALQTSSPLRPPTKIQWAEYWPDAVCHLWYI